MSRVVRFKRPTADLFREQMLLCHAPTRQITCLRHPMRPPDRLHALAAQCDASHLPHGCTADPNLEWECVDEQTWTQAIQIMCANVSFIKRVLNNELYSEESSNTEVHAETLNDTQNEVKSILQTMMSTCVKSLAVSWYGLSNANKHKCFGCTRNGKIIHFAFHDYVLFR